MKGSRKVYLLFFWLFSVSAMAQINTDRMMLMGRNALYYEDYVLSIRRFNMVISAKPYLSEPYFYRGLAKFYLEDYTVADGISGTCYFSDGGDLQPTGGQPAGYPGSQRG